MKKKFAILAGVAALVCASSLALTACNNDKPDEDPKDSAKYTGLFTYTRNVEGYVNYNDLVLKDDGSFYLVTFMATNVVGTYEYNSDKTKITFDAENDDHYDGTYDVAVSNDSVVTIKDYTTFSYPDDNGNQIWYSDDYVYNTVRPTPAEPKVTIVAFYIQGDENARLEFYTGGKYELKVTDPKILSNGNYTSTKSGNTTTYTLTDTLNDNNATYTFTSTYTEDDGYSNLKLTGTGIGTDGIEFVKTVEKEVASVFKGTATNSMSPDAPETFVLKNYADGTFDLDFTMFGQPGKASGTWELKDNYTKIEYTVTDGDSKDMVKSLVGTNDFSQSTTDPTTTVAVTINVAEVGAEYSATLTEYKKLLSYSGEVTSNMQSTEKVTLTHYSDGTFELTYTSFGANDVTVAGTYTADPLTYLNTYVVTDGPVNQGVDTKDCVKSVTMAFGEGFTVSYSVAIEIPMGEYGTLTYTATLSQAA